MTPVLTLAHKYDKQVTPQSTLSLLSYTDGIEVASNGWAQGLPNGGAPVTEVFTLRINGTSQNDLAANVQALDAMIENHRRWAEGKSRYGVWLQAKLDTETNTREALVLHMERSNQTSLLGPTTTNAFWIAEYSLLVERMPAWEATSSTALTPASAVSVLAGTVAFSGVPGDIPARIPLFSAAISSGGISLNETWVGIRTTEWGAVADFLPLWELDGGAIFMTDTTGATLSGVDAYGNYGADCDFATDETMIARLTVDVNAAMAAASVSGVETEQRGTFLVLARMRVTGTAVCNVRMGAGYSGAGVFAGGPGGTRVPVHALQGLVRVSSTNWVLYPLGIIRIPPTDVDEVSAATYEGLIGDSSVQILASLFSGSGNLQVNVLGMLPIDQGMIHGTNSLGSAIDLALTVSQSPADVLTGAMRYATDSVVESVAVESNDWGLPVGSGRLYIFAQGTSSGNVLADTIDVDVSYVPRYSTFRGNT